MDFMWDDNNTEPLRNHGIPPDLAEKVFWTGLDGMTETRIRHRYMIEGKVGGKHYRLFCDISSSETVYLVTGYRI